MPELSQTTIVVIIAAILLLGAVLVMRRRLGKFSVKAGGLTGSASASGDASRAGPVIISGDGNRIDAKGFGAPRLGKDDDPT